MNKIFKVIYNNAKHCYVVASELAKSYTKGGGSRSIRRAAIVLGIAAAVYAAAGSAFANDGGDYVESDYIGKADTNPPYSVTIDDNVSGSVYGHKEDGNQNVSKANVTMTGGKIAYNYSIVNSGNLYGGYSYEGKAASNSVNISGGTINGYVSGGYAAGSGDANENQVTMTDGEITYEYSINKSGNLYGGYSISGSAASNSVIISGGTVEYGAIGGYSESGNAAINSVNVSGGTINAVHGGLSKTGNAASNSVNISGGNITYDVCGGLSGNGNNFSFGNVTSNSVYISGDTTQIDKNVYGGYVESGTGSASYNLVTISGGTINGYVSGGYAAGSGDANGNQVTMTGGEITYDISIDKSGNLYGGYSNSGSAASNSVIISGGTVNYNACGGFSDSGLATNNSVNISGGNVNAVNGGGATIGDAASNSVNISGGTITYDVCGGFSGNEYDLSSGNVTSNSVYISGDTTEIKGRIFGGYTIAGTGDVNCNKVIIKSGTVYNDVFGGSSNLGDAASNSVNISGGAVNGSVYGGFSLQGNAFSNSVNISGDTTQIDKNVYGGYVKSGTGSASYNLVTISGGTINGYVSGGYAAGSGDANENQVTMTGGEITYDDSIENSGNLYGGFSSEGNASSNSVNISGDSSLITDSVYGGYVDSGSGSATSNSVTINGGTVISVYGGYVNSGSGNASSNSVNINEVEVGGSVWGGVVEDASGDANGNSVTITNVTICGSVLGGNVWKGNGDANADSNSVTINGGTVYGDVYGAEVAEGSGDASRNFVTINKGIVDSVIGGEVWNGSGNAASNSVTINSGTIGSVYGGNVVDGDGDAINNSVNLKDGIIQYDELKEDSGNLYGGKSVSGKSYCNSVCISGGTINGFVSGGYTAGSGDANENQVTMTGGEIVCVDSIEKSGSLYGGYSSEGNASSNNINISDGIVNGSVHGGYSETGNAASNSVNLSIGIVNKDLIGGRSESGNAVDNSVNITEATVKEDIVGGYSEFADANRNNVEITDGTIPGRVFGGFSFAGNSTDNSVSIGGDTKETIESVFGGFVYSGNGLTKNNKVSISSGIIREFVIGGSSYDGDSVNNSINISGGTINDCVYGGYSETGNVASNSVYISGGKACAVFGGFAAVSGNANENHVNMTGGEIVYDDSKSYSGSIVGGYAETGNAASNIVSISGGTVGSVIGGFTSDGDSLGNLVNISGCTFRPDSFITGGDVYSPENSTISDNIVNLGSNVTGLDNSEVYGYYFKSGSVIHSGNELHIGRTLAYDSEGNIQRDSEGNIIYKSDSSTIWQGKSSDGTVNNSINKIANFDSIALHSVAWNKDLPAIEATTIENIDTVDITDLKFYENGSEKTAFALNDKMNLLTWENDDEGPINLKYKLNGTGDEQTGAFADNQKGFVVQTKAVSETNNGIELNGTETGKVKKVDKAVQFAYTGIFLNSVDLSNWDGINTSEVSDEWTADDNGVSVVGVFKEPELSSGESKNILTASTDLFKNENIDESIRYSEIQFINDCGNGVTLSGLQTGGVKASNDGKYLSYYAIKKTADNLTFGNVEWLDKGALIDHKTMLNDVSFDGATVDTTKIAFINKEKLSADMKMTLVSDFDGNPGTITGSKYKVGTAYEGEGSAYMDGNDLVFKTKTGAGLSDETHTTVMSMEAGIAMLAAGSERVGNAIEGLELAANTGSDGVSTFASVGGASSRYETGSHVDTNSWNCTLAVGKTLEKKEGNFEYGLFAEYGRGNYTLHMNGIDDAGNGSTHYTGGGLLLKWTNSHNVFTEASFRMGNMKDNASSLLHDGAGNSYGYDVKAKYRGGHFGFGKICKEEDGTKLEIFGKYFYNQREGINFAAGGDQYSLEDVRSRVLRAGFRLSSTDRKWNRYGGISYDYEFGGQSNGTVNGTQIRAASIKGGTIRGEFGYCREATKTNPWKTDISLYGTAGKRNGFGGSIAVEYHF